MPRIANETSALLADLQSRLQNLVEAARREGHAAALHQIRGLVGASPDVGAPARRGPGRPRGSKNKPKDAPPARSGTQRKNSWSGLTAEQKLARVNAIRKGRGLPPKTA
jgi:hypothetical protein